MMLNEHNTVFINPLIPPNCEHMSFSLFLSIFEPIHCSREKSYLERVVEDRLLIILLKIAGLKETTDYQNCSHSGEC